MKNTKVKTATVKTATCYVAIAPGDGEWRDRYYWTNPRTFITDFSTKATLQEDMSVKWERKGDLRNSNSSFYDDEIFQPKQLAEGVSSVAKIEWEHVDAQKVVLRCRVARLAKKKGDIALYADISGEKNQEGVIELLHPYNEANDRFLVLDLKKKTLEVTKKNSKGMEILKTVVLENADMSINKFANLVNKCLMRQFKSIIFVDDDFFKPILDLCQKEKALNYVTDIMNDPELMCRASVWDRYVSGIYFDKSLQDMNWESVHNLKYLQAKPKSSGRALAGYYDLSKMHSYYRSDVIRQIAGCLFMISNSGIESIYKSIYKPTLIDDILYGKVYISSKINQINGLENSEQKALNKTIELLSNPENFMADGANFSSASVVNAKIVTSISNSRKSLARFFTAVNGYNNYMECLNVYLKDYWYYEFLVCSYRVRNKHGYGCCSEEFIFVETVDNMLSQFVKDIQFLTGFLVENPNYANNVSGFIHYFTDNCRKQGFADISNMAGFMQDYLRMQKTLKARAEKYPSSLLLAHNIANINVTLLSEAKEHNSAAFSSAVEEYRGLEYTGHEFVVRCPRQFTDLFVEGASLNHCVANYISKVNDGSCKILFLRKRKEQEVSFYTIAVENDHEITQVKGLNQKDPDTIELKDFVSKWAKSKQLTENYM